LTLSPFAASPADREIALYLFLLTMAYAWPLWVHSLWIEVHRRRPVATPSLVSWPQVALQGIGCGLAVAALLVLRSRTSLDFIYFQF